MYVDPEIILPPMPKWLVENVQELTDFYNMGDEVKFLLYEEAVCADVKQAHLDRQISREDADTIFEYFGWK